MVTITGPPNGGMLDFGQNVAYNVSVTDAQDGTINCAQVFVNPALGHDDHAHPTTDLPGCSGTINTSVLGGHPDGANLFYLLNARYQDNGNGTVGRLTGFANATLQPKHKQAEYFTQPVGRPGDRAGRRPRAATASATSATTTGSCSAR